VLSTKSRRPLRRLRRAADVARARSAREPSSRTPEVDTELYDGGARRSSGSSSQPPDQVSLAHQVHQSELLERSVEGDAVLRADVRGIREDLRDLLWHVRLTLLVLSAVGILAGCLAAVLAVVGLAL
jgi:hypothetical protein